MSKTITSSSITFIDNTDNRKIEAFISSNLPTTQIYNVNTQEYSPDWASQPLTLIPTVYLDSSDITSDATIQWERKYGTDAAESITSDKNLIISSNELSQNSGMVTYICKAEYQSMTAITQIVFTRVDTGLNGVAGANGTSVTILGIAYANTSISLNNYYTLYSDSDCTTAIDTSGLENGDSYLVNGYLCIYNTTQQQFLCTGKIQGPQGIQGESAKQIVLSANSQLFKVNKLGVLSPTTITVVGSAFNTSITSWKYSVDGGNTYNITANGASRNGNVVTITGADMTSNSITIKASDDNRSDILTVYKISDGIDGADGQMGASAPIAFLTNEHIGFASDSSGQVPFQTVTTSVVAYNGNTKVTPTIGTISNLPTGMSINTDNIKEVNNELIIPIVIEHNSTFGGNSGTISIPVLSPINSSLKLSWSKVTSGTDAITFQVYSNNGLVLSKAESSITLNTFAYDGSTAITSGATYQWYVQSEDEWVAIADATNNNLVVNKEDVLKSGAYQCQMTYKDNIYYSTISVQDKSEEYRIKYQTIPNGADLNDAIYKTPGFYRSTSLTNSITNKPSAINNGAFELVVTGISDFSYCTQTVKDISSNTFYIRTQTSLGSSPSFPTWTEWSRILTSDIPANQYYPNYGINMNNSDLIGANSIYFANKCDSVDEGINFLRYDGGYDVLYAADGGIFLRKNQSATPIRVLTDDLMVIRRGTCTLNVSSATTVNFSSALPGIPTVMLTPLTNNSGVIAAKVRSVTASGFTAIIGGSGISDTQFAYLAIWTLQS